MPTFPDLRDFFDPALKLPVGGVEYRIEAPDANEALRLRQIFLGDADIPDEQHVIELLKILGAELDETGSVRGGVAEEMVTNGVSWDELVHIGSTALVHFGVGDEAGVSFWANPESVTAPEQPKTQPKKAPAKRAPAKKAAPAKRAAK